MPRDGNRYDDRDSVCLCPFRKAAGNETLKTRRREIPANIVLPVEASIFEHRFLPSFSWETRDFLEMRGDDEKKSKRGKFSPYNRFRIGIRLSKSFEKFVFLHCDEILSKIL